MVGAVVLGGETKSGGKRMRTCRPSVWPWSHLGGPQWVQALRNILGCQSSQRLRCQNWECGPLTFDLSAILRSGIWFQVKDQGTGYGEIF